MNTSREISGLQLRSLVKPNGELELSLAETVIPAPAPDEVVVRIAAAPINPSDILLMLTGADISTMRQTGSGKAAVLTMDLPPDAFSLATARIGLSLPLGYEAAGVVIAAGASDAGG